MIYFFLALFIVSWFCAGYIGWLWYKRDMLKISGTRSITNGARVGVILFGYLTLFVALIVNLDLFIPTRLIKWWNTEIK